LLSFILLAGFFFGLKTSFIFFVLPNRRERSSWVPPIVPPCGQRARLLHHSTPLCTLMSLYAAQRKPMPSVICSLSAPSYQCANRACN
uniref:Uncharacterized protein n=1 Tax=Takifugu rubripes TaxID=31033 RepID=A0A674N643_TAKRU